MSETVVFEPATDVETDKGIDASEDNNSGYPQRQEKTFPRLDGEVGPLVAANADVIVRCPWMGDAGVTLAEAIISYPRIMTEEIADLIIADIYMLLANRVAEEPDQAGEESTDNEETAETNEDKQSKTDADSKDKSEKKTKDSTESWKHVNKPVETKNEKKIINGTAAVKSNIISRAKTEKTKPNPAPETQTLKAVPSAKIAQAEPTAQNNSPHAIKGEANYSPAGGEMTDTSPSVPAKVIVKIDKLKPDQDEPKVPNTQRIEETRGPVPYLPKITIQQKTKMLDALEVLPSNNEPDEKALLALEPENEENGLFEFTVTTEGAISLPEDIVLGAIEPVTLFERIGDYELEEGFVEPEIITELEIGAELIVQDQQIVIAPERADQTHLVVDKTEEALIELAESFQLSQPEVIEELNEILDKIIELPEQLEAQSDESIINEVDIRQDLEELFTELFETAGIDYAEELIQSLAYLTIAYDLAGEIEKIKQAKIDDMPKDRGTHEIIKKLLAVFSTIKKAIANAGAIGKSALRLYILSSAV